MAKRDETDFLRFSAYSIKDLITRKLSEDSRFTDQIYEGSNLAILIDIVSYMFQCLMFNLNSAAAESMWSDTQIYENINRLCQFLGYNPHGMNPAFAEFTLKNDGLRGLKEGDDENHTIHVLKYSSIDTKKVDSHGKRIYYSTVTPIDVNPQTPKEVTLYNGKWKLYPTIPVASGTPWESFTLTGLRSDASTFEYVSGQYLDVYIKKSDGKFYQFYSTDTNLFKYPEMKHETDSQPDIPRLYNNEDRIFSIRLDENKTYVITFGDGRLGQKLESGDQIYVFYLDTNGPEGHLESGELKDLTLENSPANLNINNELWMGVFGKDYEPDLSSVANIGDSNYIYTNFSQIVKATNRTTAADSVDEETVEEIRDNAPNWFKMGNRLVTKKDYEYYLKNSAYFRGNFCDVKVMNNWEYMATYYKWLYRIGLEKHGEGRYYFNSGTLLKRAPKRYIDPADANNIYIWCKSNIPAGQEYNDQFFDGLKSKIYYLKDLTHEPIFVEPVNVNFRICALGNDSEEHTEQIKRMFRLPPYQEDDYTTDIGMADGNYIEITLDDSIIFTNANIVSKIENTICDYFDRRNQKIGQVVDFNVLQNRILAINGVTKIRTIYQDPDDSEYIVTRSGLCFATWTDDHNIIEVGDDLEVSNISRTLEPFQFASLVNVPHDPTTDATNINSIPFRIKIIKHSGDILNRTVY